MKTTIDIPDDLYRRAKAKSALEGEPIRTITIQLFTNWVDGTYPTPRRQEELSVHETPPWYGSVGKKIRKDVPHDMAAVRESIAKGRRG